MKRYRVWEAARQTFLFAANWLDPELRDDQTHLFTALLSTLMQGSVPDQVRGRSTSFYMLGLLAGIPSGAFVIGRISDAIGMRQALFIDAALLGSFAIFLIASGRLRLLDVHGILEEHPAYAEQLLDAPGLPG